MDGVIIMLKLNIINRKRPHGLALVILMGLFVFILFSGCLEKTPAPSSAVDPNAPTVSRTSAITPIENQKTFLNSIGMEFVEIPAGEFDMGSPWNEAGRFVNEEPVHRVKISNAFYLGKYEVTQKQWRDVMGNVPSFKGDNLPVDHVSWNDIQDYIKKLNEKEGVNKYRLPTEAEWEYSARAGTTTSFSFGNDDSKLRDYAWYDANSESKSHDVGQKKPNPWGLYDIYGNVFEFVQDLYQDNYNGAPIDGSSWEGSGSNRVIRSGSYANDAAHARSASRAGIAPSSNHFPNLGFRLVREV